MTCSLFAYQRYHWESSHDIGSLRVEVYDIDDG